MQRICVIIPYFGRWPKWFDLYLDTCRFNSSIDWLFFTDLEPPAECPANVLFHRMSLQEFSELATCQLKMPVDFSYPFKICDVRPAFAHIFRDYIANYQFWCWGDLDVFYGDLRRFLTDRRLERTDVISPRAGFLAGEFSLFRNDERINSLYRQSRDYEEVFTSNRCWNFCEFGFFRDRTVDSMTHVLLRAVDEGRASFWSGDILRTDRKIKGNPFRLFWCDGRLRDLQTAEELLLYHFIDLKKSEAFHIPAWPFDRRHGFFLTEAGVEPATAPFTPPRRPVAFAGARLRAFASRIQSRLRKS